MRAGGRAVGARGAVRRARARWCRSRPRSTAAVGDDRRQAHPARASGRRRRRSTSSSSRCEEARIEPAAAQTLRAEDGGDGAVPDRGAAGGAPTFSPAAGRAGRQRRAGGRRPRRLGGAIDRAAAWPAPWPRRRRAGEPATAPAGAQRRSIGLLAGAGRRLRRRPDPEPDALRVPGAVAEAARPAAAPARDDARASACVAARHGAAFAAGVVLCFVLLAGAADRRCAPAASSSAGASSCRRRGWSRR
ncbi:MAG: hypothetical protein MZW92_77750 [Comamonadaceae bacterium]|nr:hypothetical protein [Comamonadaceae bacterium]